MHTSVGDLRWHKPVAYQDLNGRRKAVECSYVATGAQRLGFRLHTYDRTEPLIIDPQLDYSTYLGGSNSDSGQGIAVDANGNAYVTGGAGSDDFPIKNAFQSTNFGNAFITKFDAAGNLVYSTFLGGHGGDYGNAIAVDAMGHAYVTGLTGSFDFPTKNPFQKNLQSQLGNAFVTKLDTNGDALIYSTYLGGSGNPDVSGGESTHGIAVDEGGNAYVSGDTASTDVPTKNAFHKSLKGGFQNAFVTKLCPAGNELVYSTYLGGSVQDQGTGIAVDAFGNAYITGGTASPESFRVFRMRSAISLPLIRGMTATPVSKPERPRASFGNKRSEMPSMANGLLSCTPNEFFQSGRRRGDVGIPTARNP